MRHIVVTMMLTASAADWAPCNVTGMNIISNHELVTDKFQYWVTCTGLVTIISTCHLPLHLDTIWWTRVSLCEVLMEMLTALNLQARTDKGNLHVPPRWSPISSCKRKGTHAQPGTQQPTLSETQIAPLRAKECLELHGDSHLLMVPTHLCCLIFWHFCLFVLRRRFNKKGISLLHCKGNGNHTGEF